MARGRPYRFARFARGLNTADGPYGLREGYEDDPSGMGSECRAAQNVVSRHRGNISRRNGCAVFADPDLDATYVAAHNLVTDPTGSGGLATWAGTNATVSTPPPGIRATGTGGQPRLSTPAAGPPYFTVTAGERYALVFTVTENPQTRLIFGEVRWFDSGGTLISNDASDADTALTTRSLTAEAPASAVSAQVRINGPTGGFAVGNTFAVNGVYFGLDRTLRDISVIGQDASSFAVCSSEEGELVAFDTAGNPTVLVASGLADAPWSFLRLPTSASNGPAFGLNGTDTPRETDGTLAGTGSWTATAGSVPNGTAIAYHSNRVLVVGTTAFPYRLYASAPGDPRDWDTAGNAWVTDFAPDDGSPLIAVASLGSYALVFKERGLWVVYDAETGANRKIADNVGTLAQRSVVSTEVGCFFLDAERGVMLTDGSSAKRVSAQIQPVFDAIAQADLAAADAAYINGHYYLAITSGGVRIVLDYDTELDSWWVHTVALSALGVWDQGLGPVLIGVQEESAQLLEVFKDGELEDAGEAFTALWSSPWHTFRAGNVRKRCREVHLDGRGTVDVYVGRDFEAGSGIDEEAVAFAPGDSPTFGDDAATAFFGIPDPGTFGGTVVIGEGNVYTLGVARAWSLTFLSTASEFFEIDAYTMLMNMRTD